LLLSFPRRGAANEIEKIFSNIKGLDNIDRDDKLGKSRIEVALDFEKMARLNVDFATVNRYLRSAFTGIDVTDIRYGDTDVDFRMYLGSPNQSEAVISTLKISNRNARPVPLKQFSSIQYIDGEPDFNHFDGQRSVLVSGSVDDQVTTSQAVIKQMRDLPNLSSLSILSSPLILEKIFSISLAAPRRCSSLLPITCISTSSPCGGPGRLTEKVSFSTSGMSLA
jgi:multidrug efflux pump subunit AcrB